MRTRSYITAVELERITWSGNRESNSDHMSPKHACSHNTSSRHGTGVQVRTASLSFGGSYAPKRHRYVCLIVKKKPLLVAGAVVCA